MPNDEFINSFRKASQHLDKNENNKSKEETPPKQDHDIQKELVRHYREEYSHVDLDVLRNLNEIKEITQSTNSEAPDKALAGIEKRLGEPEVGETLRQERWGKKVKCPECASEQVQKLADSEQKVPHIYKYVCLSCWVTFNDDSHTEMESELPPLYTWMLCWYLYGCTSSIQYIATKLGLDTGLVEMMIKYMQKIFKSSQPLTNFLTFDEWSMKYGKTYKSLIKENLVKKEVLLGRDTAETPADTHEYKKQKDNFRGPNPKPRN